MSEFIIGFLIGFGIAIIPLGIIGLGLLWLNTKGIFIFRLNQLKE